MQKCDQRIAALNGRVLPKLTFIEQCDAYTLYGYNQWGKVRDTDTLITANAIIDRRMFDDVGGFDENFRKEGDRALALKLITNGYRVMFSPSVNIVHDHIRKTLIKHLIYNYNIGKKIGLELELKYGKIRRIPYPKGIENPYVYAMLVPLISLVITGRIFLYNVKYDPKIIFYLPFIFAAKMFWRYGAVNWLWQNRKTKLEGRFYHNRFKELSRYDRRIAREYRLEHKYFTVQQWISILQKRGAQLVLDYGCGTGGTTLVLKREGLKVISLDTCADMLEYTCEKIKKELGEPKGFYICGDGEQMPFKKGILDSVFCLGVLHHLRNPNTGLREIVRVLKPGGLFFISEPYSNRPPLSMVLWYIKCILIWANRIITFRSVQNSERIFTPKMVEELTEVLRQNKIEYEVEYLVYPFLLFKFMPEMLGYRILRFLNKKTPPGKGDVVNIKGQKQ